MKKTMQKRGPAQKKELVHAPSIKSANALMEDLEKDILAVKSGELSEPRARIVATLRRHEVKIVELTVAAARIEVRLRPQLQRTMGAPIASLETAIQ